MNEKGLYGPEKFPGLSRSRALMPYWNSQGAPLIHNASCIFPSWRASWPAVTLPWESYKKCKITGLNLLTTQTQQQVLYMQFNSDCFKHVAVSRHGKLYTFAYMLVPWPLPATLSCWKTSNDWWRILHCTTFLSRLLFTLGNGHQRERASRLSKWPLDSGQLMKERRKLYTKPCFYCKRSQNLIRTAHRWSLFPVGFCVFHSGVPAARKAAKWSPILI